MIPKNISSKAFETLGFKVKKVDNNFFGTIRRANEMYLSKSFYEIFKKYDFMLIYQLDALVFSNQLEKWVNSEYDFVAAPWVTPVIGYLSHKNGSPPSGGNGGFSLRNIKISKNTKAKLFIASGSGDPGTPFCTQDASSNLSDPSFFVDLQPQSVTGIIFTEIKPTFKSLFQRDDSVGDCLVGF